MSCRKYVRCLGEHWSRENSNSGSDDWETSATRAGLPVGRPSGPSMPPMDTDDHPAIVGGRGLSAQAPPRVMGLLPSGVPPGPHGTGQQQAKREFVPRKCELCSGDRIFETCNSYNVHLKRAHGNEGVYSRAMASA